MGFMAVLPVDGTRFGGPQKATDVPALARAPAPTFRCGVVPGDLAGGQPPGSDTGFDPLNRGPHDPRATSDRLRRLPQGGRPRRTNRPGGRLPQGQEARLPVADRLRRAGREDLQRATHAPLPEGGARSQARPFRGQFPATADRRLPLGGADARRDAGSGRRRLGAARSRRPARESDPVKAKELVYLLGLKPKPKSYGYAIAAYNLPREGRVEGAQWRHPGAPRAAPPR